MASGDTLCVFDSTQARQPTSNFAVFNERNAIAILDFDPTTSWAAIFTGFLPRNYAGGGLTVTIHWIAASATSGNCVWRAYIERMNTDEDADSFTSAQTATGAANGTSGIITATSITFTSGANMDSLAAGEPFRLKVDRDAANASDTMTARASIIIIEVKET